MPKLRALSGKEIVKILSSFGFEIASQRGSHAKLKREISNSRQILTIPMHGTLDRGTLQAIYRQAGRYLTEEELRPHFYTK